MLDGDDEEDEQLLISDLRKWWFCNFYIVINSFILINDFLIINNTIGNKIQF